MELNNLLILLQYYTLTYWWTAFEVLFIVILFYILKKYKTLAMKIFSKGGFLIFVAMLVMTIINNYAWAKRLTEILFILTAFLAINLFLKDFRKK